MKVRSLLKKNLKNAKKILSKKRKSKKRWLRVLI